MELFKCGMVVCFVVLAEWWSSVLVMVEIKFG